VRANATPTEKKSLTTMTNYRSIGMNTLYEALARARMTQPHGEANREDTSARRVAMRAKARQARELGEAQAR
jgi:hypothetical protein